MAGPVFAPKDVCSKVELSISCTNLKDLDYFSKSDPVVYLFERRGQHWEKINRTEVIDNNLNPKFSKTFLLDYRFEEVQQFKFSVYDVDDRKHIDDVSKHDVIGEAECTLADIVTAGKEYSRSLRHEGAPRGKIIILAEEVQDSKFTIHMQMSASKLDKKDFFGKSDPFLEVSKTQEGSPNTVVYRSDPIMKTLDPRWPPFEIPISQLCSGDWDRTLQMSVWDWNKGGEVFSLDIINESAKKKKKKYHNSGTLTFSSVKATPLHSFMDYIRGGYEINLVVAIDFTASNGKPHDPKSLHYRDPYKDNQYVQAIKSVGSVLAPYDSDQNFPVYGFGARIPPQGQVSHCFPLTMNEQRPEVCGIQGILDSYYRVLNEVELYGPTNFSYFIDRAMSMARANISENYVILLVITDGAISDMSRTVDRIVEASNLPMSIVIVGVGGADFSKMDILDADDEPLRSSNGVSMSRDIVQFVPFRKQFTTANFSLTRETLAEIPGQFLSFMKRNGITPKPPPLKKQNTTFYNHPQQTSSSPYPESNTNSAPYPGSNPTPYPGSNPNTAPYPGSNPTPYPTGSNPNSAPYPGSHSGPAPYPGPNPNSASGYPPGNSTPQATAPPLQATAPPPYPV